MSGKRVYFPFLSPALALAGVVVLLGFFYQPKTAHADPANRYVSVSGVDASNDCLISNSPCRTIQHAVNVAVTDDHILVASGVYTGVNSHPKPIDYLAPLAFTNVEQIVYLDKSVAIRGGYTDAFSEPPDPEANPTTLDAEGFGRVFFIYGAITATIEGLRITGGDDTGLYGEGGFQHAGGGIYGSGSVVNLRDNQVFENNGYYGGGLYLRYSHITLDSNTIISNTGHYGGGINLYYSEDATIISNTIRSNTANSGGGLVLSDSNGLVSANKIVSNSAASNGGGLYLIASDDSIIRENTIISNTSGADGGGLYLYATESTIAHNTIVANHGVSGGGLNLNMSDSVIISNTIEANIASTGGGLLMWYSNPELEANLIIGNRALNGGGCGLWLLRCSPRLVNNVVNDNQTGAATGTALFIADNSEPQLIHTTIARNCGSQGTGVYVAIDSTLLMTDTILTGHKKGLEVSPTSAARLEATLWGNTTNWTGSGVIQVGVNNTWGNPYFAGDGYHLTARSVAIDHGVAAGVLTDVDNETRPGRLGYDLGADECLDCSMPTLYFTYLPLLRH